MHFQDGPRWSPGFSLSPNASSQTLAARRSHSQTDTLP
jgi:hypothetical protein